MPFKEIQGQPAALSVLRRMVARERVPGALLFLGPPHVGKRTAALALAQALNCDRRMAGPVRPPAAAERGVPEDSGPDACGACPSCRKIEAGAHPDVEVVAPDGQFIKIDQIRAVGDRLGLNPLQARRRLIVLAQAERMTLQAANAFLKTLEEPPADTTLVLCATEASLLPETIVSRCLPVRFAPLSEPVLRALLQAQVESKAPKRGRSTGAEAAQEGAVPESVVLDFAVRFAQGSLRPELKDQAAAWYGLREELLAALDELPAGGDLLGERLTRFSAKETGGFVLEWLETWWRDVAVLAAGGAPEHLINGDRQAALAPWTGRLGLREAQACYRRVLSMRDALTVNVNATLALESLWLGFKHTLHDAGSGPMRPDAGGGPVRPNPSTRRST